LTFDRYSRQVQTWENWEAGNCPPMKVIVKAPKREKPAPSWSLVVSLLRREAIELTPEATPAAEEKVA
jgi:hypothetical protein